MSKQTINIGASPNDGTGTPLRTSFDYTNQNFTEIYTALGGGVALPGATTQVIFNDGGTNLAGDAGLVYNKTTDALTVAGLVTAGSATITGDLTVRTNKLKVDATGVGIGTATPLVPLHAETAGTGTTAFANFVATFRSQAAGRDATLQFSDGTNQAAISMLSGALSFGTGGANTRYQIDSTGISTWSVAGTTAMTLNSTGLGIGDAPTTSTRLTVAAANRLADTTGQAYIRTTDSYAQDLGGQLTLGGLYNASANYAFGGIAGRKENGTINNVAGYLDFLTTTSAGALTSRMRIDSSGNVGIGVTPSAWGSSYKSVQATLGAALAGATGNLALAQNCYYDGTNWVNNRASTFSSRYDMNVAGNGIHAWYVYNASFGTVGNTIPFTQAMTLKANGSLLIGTIASLYDVDERLSVSGVSGKIAATFAAIGTSSIGLLLSSNIATGATSGKQISFVNSAGVEVGSVTSNGTGTLFNVTSDNRLKENIKESASSSDLIDGLQVRQFDWKSDKSHQRYGFVAQELVIVAPEAVYQPTDPKEMMSVDYSKLVPMLVKEIQSLRTRVQTLEAR